MKRMRLRERPHFYIEEIGEQLIGMKLEKSQEILRKFGKISKILQKTFGFVKKFQKSPKKLKKGVDKKGRAWYSTQALSAAAKTPQRENANRSLKTIQEAREKQGQSRNESFETLRDQRFG